MCNNNDSGSSCCGEKCNCHNDEDRAVGIEAAKKYLEKKERLSSILTDDHPILGLVIICLAAAVAGMILPLLLW
jgi:hypothetical protein